VAGAAGVAAVSPAAPRRPDGRNCLVARATAPARWRWRRLGPPSRRIGTAAPASRPHCRDSHLPASDSIRSERPRARGRRGRSPQSYCHRSSRPHPRSFLSAPAIWNALEVSRPGHQPSADMREPDTDGLAFNLHRIVHRAVVFDLLAIHVGPRDARQTVDTTPACSWDARWSSRRYPWPPHGGVGDLQRLRCASLTSGRLLAASSAASWTK